MTELSEYLKNDTKRIERMFNIEQVQCEQNIQWKGEFVGSISPM